MWAFCKSWVICASLLAVFPRPSSHCERGSQSFTANLMLPGPEASEEIRYVCSHTRGKNLESVRHRCRAYDDSDCAHLGNRFCGRPCGRPECRWSRGVVGGLWATAQSELAQHRNRDTCRHRSLFFGQTILTAGVRHAD